MGQMITRLQNVRGATSNAERAVPVGDGSIPEVGDEAALALSGWASGTNPILDSLICTEAENIGPDDCLYSLNSSASHTRTPSSQSSSSLQHVAAAKRSSAEPAPSPELTLPTAWRAPPSHPRAEPARLALARGAGVALLAGTLDVMGFSWWHALVFTTLGASVFVIARAPKKQTVELLPAAVAAHAQQIGPQKCQQLQRPVLAALSAGLRAALAGALVGYGFAAARGKPMGPALSLCSLSAAAVCGATHRAASSCDVQGGEKLI